MGGGTGRALLPRSPVPACSTPGGVVGGGTRGSRDGRTHPVCAQRRVASWGVAPAGSGRRAACSRVLNAGWRRGGWHHEEKSVGRPVTRAQRRVASWGVARSGVEQLAARMAVLNAGWRRGGWHTRGWATRWRRRCAQRRVASWGVAHADSVGVGGGLKCSTPGGVVGGGTRRDRLRVVDVGVLNAGWRRGGWHLTGAVSVDFIDTVLNAGWRRGGWHLTGAVSVDFIDTVLNAGWRRGGWHCMVPRS